MRNFSAISWRKQVTIGWYDDDVHLVPDQHAELDFYSASSLKQQSMCRHVAPHRHIILIPRHFFRTSYSKIDLNYSQCMEPLGYYKQGRDHSPGNSRQNLQDLVTYWNQIITKNN